MKSGQLITQNNDVLNRREFLRQSALLSVPVLLGSMPFSKQATAAAFTLPTHGSAYVNVKNTGAYGDGSHDDTAAIQKAINSLPSSGGTVYVPAGRYLINAVTTLKLKSNMLFQMRDDAVLIVKPNSQERYYVLSMMNVSNIEIAGGTIIGDRDRHMGTTGEWGMGIQVGGRSADWSVSGPANRIYIHDVYIEKCWGDGICIGGGSKDVEIRRVVCTQNRRQGLSITRSTNVRVFDSEFSYTHGTSPECGIDIEPDPPAYTNYVLISNCVLKGNNKFGLNIWKRAQHITVQYCRIENNNSLGVCTTGCYDIKLLSNLIQNNGATGVRLQTDTTYLRASKNTFFNNYRRLGDRNRTDFTYTGYKSTLSRDWYFGGGYSTYTSAGCVIGTNYYK